MDTSYMAYTHTIHAASSAAESPAHISAGHQTSETSRGLNIYGPLFWLFKFLMKLTLGSAAPDPSQDAERRVAASYGNRETRRYVKHNSKPEKEDILRRRALVTRILSRGLSPAQYREKVARIFPGGRVRTYGLRFWGSRRQRRAQLSCCDNGSWQSPMTAATNSGLWDVQLPPN